MIVVTINTSSLEAFSTSAKACGIELIRCEHLGDLFTPAEEHKTNVYLSISDFTQLYNLGVHFGRQNP